KYLDKHRWIKRAVGIWGLFDYFIPGWRIPHRQIHSAEGIEATYSRNTLSLGMKQRMRLYL
ncbi:hypothetical protein, partial [Thiolapillus sp.]|uniref:hypothetical protein n=1 Tax=Thiolapillus sp. TaxID=2017437 RepID=UPI003AF47EA9